MMEQQRGSSDCFVGRRFGWCFFVWNLHVVPMSVWVSSSTVAKHSGVIKLQTKLPVGVSVNGYLSAFQSANSCGLDYYVNVE